MKAEISQKDLMEIENILFEGVAEMKDQETKRFWDGYAMCLENIRRACVTKVEVGI